MLDFSSKLDPVFIFLMWRNRNRCGVSGSDFHCRVAIRRSSTE